MLVRLTAEVGPRSSQSFLKANLGLPAKITLGLIQTGTALHRVIHAARRGDFLRPWTNERGDQLAKFLDRNFFFTAKINWA